MSTRDDLLSAALRHVRDAEHLLAAGAAQSLDQAEHLAGFAPECARKACLGESWGNQALGHNLGEFGDAVLSVLISLDVFANRYGLDGWGAKFPGLSGWRVEVRYRATVARANRAAVEATSTRVVKEAREGTDALALALFADGLVSAGAFAA
jgi:hypothetical protein